jgi:hypothetical protein
VIPDISAEEVFQYLKAGWGINREDTKKLYEFVGGRFIDLNSVAGALTEGDSLQYIYRYGTLCGKYTSTDFSLCSCVLFFNSLSVCNPKDYDTLSRTNIKRAR